MMAWLATALKSSQPSRSASCRSDSRIVLITGAAALSCAAGASGVTLPGYGVPMVVISLDATAGHAPVKGANRPFCENDHDQARRDNRKPKLAMSRTELPSYSQSSAPSLTLR